ncbi:MAG: EamA family transporter [Candidatus Bruticola sp.]
MSTITEQLQPLPAAEDKPIKLIIAFSILSLLGQYFFKLGMDSAAARQLVTLLGSEAASLAQGSLPDLFCLVWHSIVLLLQPLIFIGMVAYALSAVCWLIILSKVDLSFAYPMISIGYVAILLMGWLIFGEYVSWLRWLGVLLISLGILAVYSERAFMDYSIAAAVGLLVAAASVILITDGQVERAAYFEKPVLLIVLTIPMGVIGQILLKAGMNMDINKGRVQALSQACRNLKEQMWSSVSSGLLKACALCLSPKIFCGLCIYVISTVLWLVLLTKVPISFLYPLLSFGYVLVLLIGWLGFSEKVSFARWYGVLVICLGIVFIYSEVMVRNYALVVGCLMVALALSLLGAKYLKFAMNKVGN